MSVTIKNARLAFPSVFTAKSFPGSDKASFSVTAIIEPGSPVIKEIEAEMDRVGAEKFGAKWAAVKKELVAKDRMATHDGDLKSEYEGFPGNLYINASNKSRPTVVDRDLSAIVEADGKIYAGAYANVIVDFWAMNNDYGKRVCATLMGIQFVKHGEAFSGGGVAAPSAFEVMADDDTDDLV